MKCYVDRLSEEEKHNIKSFKSSTEIKFGDRKNVTSEKCISIPCKIAGERVNAVTDIVKSEIPLLLSKESMKKTSKNIFCKG